MSIDRKWLWALGVCTFAGSAGSAGSAHAHISITEGGTHMARTDEMKDAPCGLAGAARGANVHTYRPGETINITILETVSHPGYFRVAFDADGDDDFLTPSGTDGMDGSCGGDAACGPGKEDYCNNETVLLDHLNQHAGAFGTTPTYTFSVTLPNVECDNCTLQIIQMMNDLSIHFAPYPADDLYYQCIDLVLSNSAPEVNDVAMPNDGMTCAGPAAGGAGGAAGGAAGMAGGAGGGGMGGAGGAGGAAGAAGAAGGAAGMAGSMGTAGMAATAGMGGTASPGGAGAGAGGAGLPQPTTPQPTSSSGTGSEPAKGGCRAADGATVGGSGVLGAALVLLGMRRRRARS
jgi:hypothetical protein